MDNAGLSAAERESNLLAFQRVTATISQRFENARILARALEQGAIWECPDHPGVYLPHGVACECGRIQT